MSHDPIERDSFIERDTCRRMIALFNFGISHELLGPFRQLTPPRLPCQGIVAQVDDGVVMARDTLGGYSAVVLAIEDVFQGGGVDEVSGAKITGALGPAAEDNRNDIPTHVIIVFETGGVRLQKANLGLAVIVEIHADIRALRRYGPVIGITTGVAGCFGGMSIAAGLYSYLSMTREARLGLSGPQVIEQEADIEEYGSRDHPSIWSLTGGEQRTATGLIDVCIEDDSVMIRTQVIEWLCVGTLVRQRSEQIDHYLVQLAVVNTSRQATAEGMRAYYVKDVA